MMLTFLQSHQVALPKKGKLRKKKLKIYLKISISGFINIMFILTSFMQGKIIIAHE